MSGILLMKLRLLNVVWLILILHCNKLELSRLA